jgi:hypothetical protein
MSTQQNIDKLGECPNCKEHWDGGDIFHGLQKMSIHIHKSEKEVKELARTYGWSEDNPIHFSRTNTIEASLPLVKFIFLECPKCLHVFDSLTGKEFSSIQEAKRKILIEEEDTP